MTVREIKTEELSLLDKFLYYAIFQKDKDVMLPKNSIEKPEIAIYIKDFGSYEDDYCLVYEEKDQIIGACWVRIIDGFGSIDEYTPEFAISVDPNYRNRGIGKKLLTKMLIQLKESKKYKQASLAVQKENYALKIYSKIGFKIIDQNKEEFIMIYKFS